MPNHKRNITYRSGTGADAGVWGVWFESEEELEKYLQMRVASDKL